MKQTLKKIISSAVKNDTIWNLLDKTALKAAQFTELERTKFEKESNKRDKEDLVYHETLKVFPDLIIKHGPFKGMKYYEAESAGSVLFPKLLGCYERELEPVLERICQEDYTEIIDVGCAEGYFAIGLAMRIPKAKVYAYDINKQATNLCEKMAKLNGVADRVIIGDFCDREELKKVPVTKKKLIVSDCEGYEKELFTDETVKYLDKTDLLIEIHDNLDISISDYIRRVFKETHNIEVIESIDDIKKARIYNYPELENYDLNMRKYLLAEHRLSIMEWFFIISKNHKPQ